MKQYLLSHTHTGRTFTDGADSFLALYSKIDTYTPEALISVLGASENGRDFYVTATALKNGRVTENSPVRELWIRIDGLGKVECNMAHVSKLA